MAKELHIQLKPNVVDPVEDVLGSFPLETGQTVVSAENGVIIIDLGDADDTNYVQEWYLNESEDVLSFYIVED